MKNTCIICPVCNGKGKIEEPLNLPKNLLVEKANIAKKLRENNYSIREIMKIMNYKSTNSVVKLLDETKTGFDKKDVQ